MHRGDGDDNADGEALFGCGRCGTESESRRQFTFIHSSLTQIPFSPSLPDFRKQAPFRAAPASPLSAPSADIAASAGETGSGCCKTPIGEEDENY